jgi:hypothetical protein
LGLVLAEKHLGRLDTSITNNKQQFHFQMINQQDSPEKKLLETSPKHRPPIFFFPPEGVPVSLKQEQKTAIEIYEGTARVG